MCWGIVFALCINILRIVYYVICIMYVSVCNLVDEYYVQSPKGPCLQTRAGLT